jgi:hypothetical protein
LIGYAEGVPFNVDIAHCNYEHDNEVAYLPIILDKNGNPTPLKLC